MQALILPTLAHQWSSGGISSLQEHRVYMCANIGSMLQQLRMSGNKHCQVLCLGAIIVEQDPYLTYLTWVTSGRQLLMAKTWASTINRGLKSYLALSLGLYIGVALYAGNLAGALVIVYL